ncbi:hypothetical protein [Ferrimicrobium sp.]
MMTLTSERVALVNDILSPRVVIHFLPVTLQFFRSGYRAAWNKLVAALDRVMRLHACLALNAPPQTHEPPASPTRVSL